MKMNHTTSQSGKGVKFEKETIKAGVGRRFLVVKIPCTGCFYITLFCVC